MKSFVIISVLILPSLVSCGLISDHSRLYDLENEQIDNLSVSDTVKKDDYFNFLLFSQQNSAAYCISEGNCVKDHVRSFWTIHGLWPSNDTTWPQDCGSNEQFDMKTLAPVRDQMDQYWPSCTSENSTDFWKHEWTKHGTCAKTIDALNGLLKYFSETLKLQVKYNLTRDLESEKIFPSETQTVLASEFENALDEELHGKVNIVCKHVKAYDQPIVTEIRFCLSKVDFTPINCVQKDEQCHDGPIYYLPVSAVK